MAPDTRLNRDVALKLVPDAFTRDPDRLARFKREAQVVASLNHLNTAAIYGFEDPGTQALVFELVEGPTVADRIVQGPTCSERHTRNRAQANNSGIRARSATGAGEVR